VIDATYRPPNLGDLTTAPEVYHKCGPRCSSTFLLTATKVDTLNASGSASSGQVGDLLVETYTSVPVQSNYRVAAQPLSVLPSAEKQTVITSSDTSVLLSPDEDGLAVAVSSGTATLVARAPDGELSAKTVAVTVTPSTSYTQWTAYAEDSLAYHCNSQIESLTAGKTTASMDVWSERNDSAASYRWNPDCWAAGVSNICCLSPYNTQTGAGGGGALITPRHAVFCHHLGYHPRVGTKIRYVKPDNTTEEVTVEAVLPHPYTDGWSIAPTDIVICKFDRDVSVPFAKVLPADPSPYLPSIPRTQNGATSPVASTALAVGVPYVRACHTSQTKKLATSVIRELANTPLPNIRPGDPDAGGIYGAAMHITGTTDYRFSDIGGNPLGQALTPGASGAPAFIIVNNELVATNVWSSPTGGTAFYTGATVVNGMLDELGGGYNLTEVDLSEFPTY